MDVTARAEARSLVPIQQDPDYIALTHTLDRYANLILETPIPDGKERAKILQWQKRTQSELWSPLPFHRMKWLRSIEGARTLLLKLEQSVQGIKVQRTKREAVKDLAEKRMIIKMLRSKVEEIGREVDSSGHNAYLSASQDNDEESESMLEVLQQIRQQKQSEQAGGPKVPNAESGRQRSPTQSQSIMDADTGAKERLFESSSNVRRRQRQPEIEAATSEGKSSGYANPQETEASLLASSATHENITADLLNMAAQLKQQARQFQFSLDQDKNLVDRAVEGLEQNMSAMGIASKGMKTLQRMSEEQGFLGRLKLQLMIAGLWMLAILLVFAGPKLRF